MMRFSVKLPAAALASLLLLTTPALAVGFQQVSVPDPGDPPLEAGIWYPSDAAASPQPLELFTETVAPNGEVTGNRLPLVVMSHGTGGSFGGHYDTALALARAGFVVAAITHTGDNYRDHSRFGHMADRPREMHSLIDYMLDQWPAHDRIDPARVGVFGFSAGGFTALVLIGAVPDMTREHGFCAEHPEDWGCTQGRERHVEVPATPLPDSAWVHDPRIKAAVIAAPALGPTFTPAGLVAVTVPIQLWRAEDDHILPQPYHAQAVYDALPVKPDYHVVPRADHFDFLAPCSEALAHVATEICRDPPDFDRAAFHASFNAAVVTFFEAKLPAP